MYNNTQKLQEERMPTTYKKRYSTKWFRSDDEFNKLYPSSIQLLSHRHWTPLVVAKKAANFLAADDNARVLDIGSGVGKFCLTAAYHKPSAFFYGVEQRKRLINNAETAREILQLENLSFINGNFTQLDFRQYDHFYFFNSFYENLPGTNKIDASIDYSKELYSYYNRYLYNQLDKKPAGTRLASFHSLEDEVPPGYHVVNEEMGGLLKFWMKI